ncbi:MAG: RidA family protein [Trebonia sp.]
MIRQAPSAKVPAPPELYSRAVVSGGQVFCSGTLGVDPVTGKAPESVTAQAEQALNNLANLLAESGSSMQGLVKTTIYYVSTEDFAAITVTECTGVTCRTHRLRDPRSRVPPCRMGCSSASMPSQLLTDNSRYATRHSSFGDQ